LLNVSERINLKEVRTLAPKSSWIHLSRSQQEDIARYGIKEGWRVLHKESLPNAFPPDFREKMDSAVLIAAPTSTGGTYLVFNARRVDTKSKAIDQEPFAIISHSTGPSSSGMFIHHGDWEGRTETPPQAFWDHVNESGIGDYFLSNPPVNRLSGTFADLPKGDRGAFEQAIILIRSNT